MPDFEAGRFRSEDRWLVRQIVEDALEAADAPLKDPSGSVLVLVRVIAPQTQEQAPERARGCATKV